jgi:WD40 repeat protein
MRGWHTQIVVGLILLLCSAIDGVTQKRNAAAPPELVLQTGHTMKVNCVAFGHNGHWLASGGADNTIKIWDVSTGRELRALKGHTGWIKSLAVSGNETWLASGSNDRTVKIWNVLTGEERHTFNGHSASVEALTFSPDDRWLASGSADNTIKIWDLATGKQMQTLRGHSGRISNLAFSHDGKFLASGSDDNTVKIWEMATGRGFATLRKHTHTVMAVSFSPDGRWLVSGSSDGTICLWRVAADEECFVMKHNSAGILAILFRASDSLTSVGADGEIAVWDTTTRREKRVISPGSNRDELLLAAFSSDGMLLAQTTGSRTVEIRSVATGSGLGTLESRSTAFYAVASSRDGKWIAAGTNDRAIRLWQLATGRELPRLSGHTGWISTIAFSPDSHLLASGSISGEVKVWDVLAGREAYSLGPTQGSINAVAFSPDGKSLAAAGIKRTVQLWDLATKRCRTFEGHSGEITTVAFSIDGRLLASGSTDKTIRLWDLSNGSTAILLDRLPDQINAISFSPDGKLLAAGSADNTVSLWDAKTGRPVKSLTGNGGEVLAVAFSPDGHLLASGSRDRSVRLWETETGQEAGTLNGASGDINSVTFSNDGRWVLSGSDDGSIALWNAQTNVLMATLVSMRDTDDWLVVTPDGLFDGSPASWNLLLWRFAGKTFNVSPVEAFFNEFYYPGVLADILSRKNPKADQDISQKDRRFPEISVSLSGGQNSSSAVAKRDVLIKVEVTAAGSDPEHPSGSGARDLRLFRNGLLVRLWSGDILKGLNRQTIEATLPVVAGENRLTAYVFNHDNVKSPDATLAFTGADNLKRVGTAYLLAIGVGIYENSQYNLNYSVADAQDIGEQLKSQQERVARYNPIVVVPLLNYDATKANILLALNRLAGLDTGPLPQNAPAALAKIKRAQPEDAVVVYFSGHGTAQKDRFYLIPHDLGYKGLRTELSAEGLRSILAHSISDTELEEAIKPLDVDQVLLVIDACNSGQALEAEEKRRGPMNTRGLAQLAYEKGMYILTASQSVEVAFESEALKHSYLTYALVEEGIRSGAADIDHDGQVLLGEWFDYATERVPRMRREKGRGSKELEEVDPNEQRVQRPRVFYTRETGARRMVIARLSNQGTQLSLPQH